jgi:hypothetical protein
LSFQSCYFLSHPKPQITSTKYFHTFSHWIIICNTRSQALLRISSGDTYSRTALYSTRYPSSTRSTTSGPMYTHTHNVSHWLQSGGAQNAQKFPINLNTCALSGQHMTRRHSHKCDTQYQHSTSCDFTSQYSRDLMTSPHSFRVTLPLEYKTRFHPWHLYRGDFLHAIRLLYQITKAPFALTSYTVLTFPFIMKQTAGYVRTSDRNYCQLSLLFIQLRPRFAPWFPLPYRCTVPHL